jgi:lysozyme
MINEAGLHLIENFEGERLTAYDDGTGVWTDGYGHTGYDVYKGVTITQARAEQLLQMDLATAEKAVEAHLKVTINPNQFAALVSLVYNVGAEGCPGIWPLINARLWEQAADRFLVYDDKGYPEQAGLDRRRQAERSLFLTDLPK